MKPMIAITVTLDEEDLRSLQSGGSLLYETDHGSRDCVVWLQLKRPEGESRHARPRAPIPLRRL